MTETSAYTQPKARTWKPGNGGWFVNVELQDKLTAGYLKAPKGPPC